MALFILLGGMLFFFCLSLIDTTLICYMLRCVCLSGIHLYSKQASEHGVDELGSFLPIEDLLRSLYIEDREQ